MASFELIVLDYALFKAKGHGFRNLVLEEAEERCNLIPSLEKYPCGCCEIRPLCDVIIKNGIDMQKVWEMVAIVGFICQREGVISVAFDFLDWLSDIDFVVK